MGSSKMMRRVTAGNSDVTTAAANLHGALLIAHGTGDDNVHFQNSVQMVNALINAGKQFQLMIYPNKTHSIAGSESRDHLFQPHDRRSFQEGVEIKIKRSCSREELKQGGVEVAKDQRKWQKA